MFVLFKFLSGFASDSFVLSFKVSSTLPQFWLLKQEKFPGGINQMILTCYSWHQLTGHVMSVDSHQGSVCIPAFRHSSNFWCRLCGWSHWWKRCVQTQTHLSTSTFVLLSLYRPHCIFAPCATRTFEFCLISDLGGLFLLNFCVYHYCISFYFNTAFLDLGEAACRGRSQAGEKNRSGSQRISQSAVIPPLPLSLSPFPSNVQQMTSPSTSEITFILVCVRRKSAGSCVCEITQAAARINVAWRLPVTVC